MTKQREAVLRVVRSEKCHYTAEEIFERAKEILPEISRATVYNNLHALERDKLIRRITGEDASDRYDSAFIPHGHLYCTECHSISDFNVPDFALTLSGIIGGEIDSYELKVRYICPACSESRATEKRA
ncbi:MAG: transcriptional repressor [Clostridia bacterium]|nr:transcriptional repressor [Clostridia bacterium]